MRGPVSRNRRCAAGRAGRDFEPNPAESNPERRVLL
jgi:hypothetical protein